MTPRDRPATKIEVTPEMRKAGAEALQELSGAYAEEQLAEAVYIAMVDARECARVAQK